MNTKVSFDGSLELLAEASKTCSDYELVYFVSNLTLNVKK